MKKNQESVKSKPPDYLSVRGAPAACKVLVKARLCRSGMKGKRPGAEIVLSLRALTHTKGRWSQFWSKINHDGCSFVQ
jgi:hypothetical protein